MRGYRPTQKHGFTLIELLVVIAIIAILAAILFPVFAQAREKSRQTVCTSRMKDFGMADNMYCQDYDEYFPAYTSGPNPSWLGKLKPYVQTLIGKSTGSERGGPLNICPSYQIEDRLTDARKAQLANLTAATRQDYGMNVLLMHPAYGGPRNLASLTRGAANVVLFVEVYDDLQPTKYDNLRYNHSDGMEITYADGHVKWMRKGVIPLTSPAGTQMATVDNPFYGIQ
jgi:prepilin-type N-terminal cleavage/methylation domain-containing protein/prepilin-type processing-associated H-X9-DG protein